MMAIDDDDDGGDDDNDDGHDNNNNNNNIAFISKLCGLCHLAKLICTEM